jgi:hypothetical protein
MVTGDLVLDFNANLGQTNAANKNIWENRVQPDSDSNDSPINCTLINYNYASNGWDSEIVNGASYPTGYLYSAGNVYGLIDYDIFSEYKNTQGLTLECVFKTEKDLGRDLPILAYHYASTDET